jgi:hypothetical protein
MFHFAGGHRSTPAPDDIRRPWKDFADLFTEQLPVCSPGVQRLYADHKREMPAPMPGIIELDGGGNPVEYRPRGGHRYMHERAYAHWLDDDLEARLARIAAECERFNREHRQAAGNRFTLIVADFLFSYVSGLRALSRWRSRAAARRFQVVELANEVAVLKTLLELERETVGLRQGEAA